MRSCSEAVLNVTENKKNVGNPEERIISSMLMNRVVHVKPTQPPFLSEVFKVSSVC